jgi:hypothetical protein
MKVDKLIQHLDKALRKYCAGTTKVAVLTFTHEGIMLEQREGTVGDKNLRGNPIIGGYAELSPRPPPPQGSISSRPAKDGEPWPED